MVEVELVDSCINSYDEKRKTILIDKRLKQYPEAFNYIKNHELKHHEIKTNSNSNIEIILRDMLHEFKTDKEIAFSNSKSINELRAYRKEIINKERNLGYFIVQSIRNIWAIPFYLLSNLK